MGRFKELEIEFYEDHRELELGSDKFFFVFSLWLKCYFSQISETISELSGFFDDIFPDLKGNECIWCMASAPDGISYNFSYNDRTEALKGLATLSNEDINLYFSPAIFTGWRTDKNASSINAIYIDIDDVDGRDFSEMSREDIKSWLCETYRIDESVLPDWVVASGHGLHLYWIVDEIDLKTYEGTELRRKYTDYLITWFKADVSCRNKSRILRFPTSRNVKNLADIKVTRLFRFSKPENKSIKRLDFFRCSDNDIEAYTSENIKRRAEKRKATMIKNGTWKERTEKHLQTKEGAEKQGVIQEKEKPKQKRVKPKIYSLAESEGHDPDEQKGNIPKQGTGAEEESQNNRIIKREIDTSPLPPKSRYLRIIRDLENYSARRHTVPKGHRSIFCHILAVYCKKARFSINKAERIMYKCIDKGFRNEADTVLKNIYASKTEYTYTNERIAELLDFKPYDLEHSYACYTAEQRKEARKKTNGRYDQKRYSEKRGDKKRIKQFRKDFIIRHTDMTAKELAKALTCSERTVRYIKADIKKEEEATTLFKLLDNDILC